MRTQYCGAAMLDYVPDSVETGVDSGWISDFARFERHVEIASHQDFLVLEVDLIQGERGHRSKPVARGSLEFTRDVGGDVCQAIRVAPFVVVPRKDFRQPLIQHLGQRSIED